MTYLLVAFCAWRCRANRRAAEMWLEYESEHFGASNDCHEAVHARRECRRHAQTAKRWEMRMYRWAP